MYSKEKKIKEYTNLKKKKKRTIGSDVYFVIGGGCPGLESTVCQFSSRTPN